MRIKQFIIIIVVVAALAGAVVFAYLTFFKDDAPTSLVTGSAIGSDNSAVEVETAILPYGDSLDFNSVKKFNRTGKIFQYPATVPGDIGMNLNDIIEK